MRLTCNFVNVHDIMYSTRTRVHARIPNGHPREEKSACRTKVRGQKSGLWRAERRAAAHRGSRPAALAAAGRADFCARRTRRLPREDPRAEVGEEVRVGVAVGDRVGPVEFKLNEIFPSQVVHVCKNASQEPNYGYRIQLPLQKLAKSVDVH